MFTGIIESLGTVKEIRQDGGNRHIFIESDISHELKVDQSVSHNGVCLTVVSINDQAYQVTAIEETLKKSNLKRLKKGSRVNLERCTRLGDRLDGHIVQGHVDGTTTCTGVEQLDGSWKFTFKLPGDSRHLMIPQGSITVNGVSLTISDLDQKTFSVAIIPYTFDHTVFKAMTVNDLVNLEYDVIGKYLYRMKEVGV